MGETDVSSLPTHMGPGKANFPLQPSDTLERLDLWVPMLMEFLWGYAKLSFQKVLKINENRE